MPNTITPFPNCADTEEARLRRRRRIEALPLVAVVEQVLRLLRCAQSELPDTRRNRQARALVGIAADDLEMALEVNAGAAARDLRETVLTALGPDLRAGEVTGARKALQLLLDCLPEVGDV